MLFTNIEVSTKQGVEILQEHGFETKLNHVRTINLKRFTISKGRHEKKGIV